MTSGWSINNPYKACDGLGPSAHKVCTSLFDYVDNIFIDCSFPLNQELVSFILPLARFCFIVTGLSLSEIRATELLWRWVRTYAPELEVKVLINETKPLINKELLILSLEKNLDKKIDLTLPFSKKMQLALLEGEAFAALFPSAAFTKPLRSFLKNLAEETRLLDKSVTSWWGKLKDLL